MATRASNSCLLLPLALAIVVAAGSTAAAPATAAPPASPPFPDGVRVRRLVHGHGEHALDHGSLLVRLRVQPALRRHLLPPLHQPLLRRPPRRRLPRCVLAAARRALLPCRLVGFFVAVLMVFPGPATAGRPYACSASVRPAAAAAVPAGQGEGSPPGRQLRRRRRHRHGSALLPGDRRV